MAKAFLGSKVTTLFAVTHQGVVDRLAGWCYLLANPWHLDVVAVVGLSCWDLLRCLRFRAEAMIELTAAVVPSSVRLYS